MGKLRLLAEKSTCTHDGRADMTNFELEMFDTRVNNYKSEKDDETCCSSSSSRNRVIKPACLPITIVSLFIIALVFLPLFKDEDLESPAKLYTICDKPCSLEVVESIPTNLSFAKGPVNKATYVAWQELFDTSEKFIDIASMHWNLNSTEYITADKGRDTFASLVGAAKRGVKVRIAQDASFHTNDDTQWLATQGLAEVRSLNFSALVGSGVLHTKFILADLKHVYIGSANMDWKSLTEVKEAGILVKDCPCFASDLYKIFSVYWRLGQEGAEVPAQWPISFRTPYNSEHPMKVDFSGAESNVFVASSPAQFNPKGREHDLAAIVGQIALAEKFVCVSVMDYFPQTLYMKNNRYWPDLDDALKAAAFRGLRVRLMVSKWDYTRKEAFQWLRSLVAVNSALPQSKGQQRGSIEVKIFEVPQSTEQKKMDHIRVNHAKYMVTDVAAYVGTSNWSGDYFMTTAGVGVIVQSNGTSGLQPQMLQLFERDWNSPYATRLI